MSNSRLSKLTLVYPKKALARIIRDASGPYYFEEMRVRKHHRRNGYCTELLRFAINYLQEYPEIDVGKRSRVLQRIVADAGYREVKPSDRFVGCDLWLHGSRLRLPSSSLRLFRRIEYQTSQGATEVLFVR